MQLRPKDLEVLRAVLRRFPAVVEARLFGSRGTGTARRASDLDLAISAPSATWADWADIREALNNAPLIYELDLVRIECATNPRLLEKIHREGIVVYPENKAEAQTGIPG